MDNHEPQSIRQLHGNNKYCEVWDTPQWFFDNLDREFHFNLDPCATHENAKCDHHFTIEDDGLSKNWGGGTLYT